MINSLTIAWPWFGPYKNNFCQIREPKKALSEHLTPGNKHQVWTDILHCILRGSLNENASQEYEYQKINVLRHVLCDEDNIGEDSQEGPVSN